MIPLRDSVPRRTYPFFNNLLILLNVAAFFLQLSQGPGLESGTDVGPMTNREQFEVVAAQGEDAKPGGQGNRLVVTLLSTSESCPFDRLPLPW